jgi:UDP-arabinose 4-epimerase
VFSKNTFDVVMHFAGFAYVGESMEEPLMYFQQNTGNVVNLLDAMRVHNVNKFIYSSTCATYGDHDEMPITEETVQVPVNPYGRSKKLAEEIIKDYSDSNPQFSAAILRWCQTSIAFTFLC